MTSTDVRPTDDSAARLDRLADTAAALLQRCRERGASQAEVSCSEEHGLSVDVRMGDVETVESTRDRGIGVTVYFGKRKGSASTADLRAESLDATVEQACAIARHTEEDPAAGLAEPSLLAQAPDGGFPDFDDHEGVHLFSDRDSGLSEIIAIHSTKLGPGAGGVRFWH